MAFQNAVKASLRLNRRDDFADALAVVDLVRYQKKDYDAVAQAIAEGPGNPGPLCAKIAALSRDMLDLVNRVNSGNPEKGISTYRYSTLKALQAAYYYSQNMKNYCLEESDPDKVAFDGTTRSAAEGAVATAQYLNEAVHGGGLVTLSHEQGCVQYVPYLDFEKLRFDFDQFRRNFDEVLSAGGAG